MMTPRTGEKDLMLDEMVARAARTLTPVPTGLADRIFEQARMRPRVARRWVGIAAGFATTAALAVVVGQTPRPSSAPPDMASLPALAVVQPETKHSEPALPTVIIDTADHLIARPLPTSNPRVSIFWLHPTVKVSVASPKEPEHQTEGRRS